MGAGGSLAKAGGAAGGCALGPTRKNHAPTAPSAAAAARSAAAVYRRLRALPSGIVAAPHDEGEDPSGPRCTCSSAGGIEMAKGRSLAFLKLMRMRSTELSAVRGPNRPSADASSATVLKRFLGFFSRQRSITLSRPAGTSGRMTRSIGGGLLATRTEMRGNVSPGKGTLPAM